MIKLLTEAAALGLRKGIYYQSSIKLKKTTIKKTFNFHKAAIEIKVVVNYVSENGDQMSDSITFGTKYKCTNIMICILYSHHARGIHLTDWLWKI